MASNANRIESETYAWNLLEELQDLFGNETRLGLVLNIHIIDRFAPLEEALGVVCVLLYKCLGLLILVGPVIVLAPVEMESFSFICEIFEKMRRNVGESKKEVRAYDMRTGNQTFKAFFRREHFLTLPRHY